VDVVSLTAVRREKPLGGGRKIDRRFLSLFFAVVNSCFCWGFCEVDAKAWCVLWSFMVKSVVKAGCGMVVFCRPKPRHEFQLYFCG
jgi:hypothetical protein